ncbi:MAG: tRNA (adenosine(37)-N6)-threonylcarbamoyltransferase complex transferase subunit TsaD [Deltaproteobacteria bacterium]|nr:tRNA (adenosine(37)-N6)-threonylcarbamoyltransferase complex transferase subunit TsaD [Deltaproteobacteria bacterium]
MYILGIETSCDETAVAIVKNGQEVLSSIVYSQIQEHTPFGGVVPEIASRSHIEHLLPVYKEALRQANMTIDAIDAIAVTSKPGLMGALMTGVTFAKTLSYITQKPLIDVHHIYGHLIAAFLSDSKPTFPLLALIASGGHTTIVRMDDFYRFETIAKSIDDAAGEALDKGAKLLGLGFPGGPAIEKHAADGDAKAIVFPIAMPDQLNFSFSGLKTSLRTYLIKNPPLDETSRKNVAASFQEAIMDTLCTKLEKAMHKTHIDTLLVCGGVARNQCLRKKLANLSQHVFLTPLAYCTDNAAMIAAAGYYSYQKQGSAQLDMIPIAHAPVVSFSTDPDMTGSHAAS